MIKVDSLTAGYGKLEILQDLSLTFADMQFSAVLGPNGSGKSTLMKAIMGINNIFGGSIQLDGTRTGRAAHRRDLGNGHRLRAAAREHLQRNDGARKLAVGCT